MSSINSWQRLASYAVSSHNSCHAMPCHMRVIKLKSMLSRDNNAELNNGTHYIHSDIYIYTHTHTHTDLITSHMIQYIC
jgi:hypothetical protein